MFFFGGGGHSRGDVDMDGMVKVVYRRSVFKICVVGDSSFVVVFRVELLLYFVVCQCDLLWEWG